MKRSPSGPPTARHLAGEVVRRVLVDDAFAAAALAAEFDRYPQLAGRDRGAATDLVYGALRAARYLDGRLVRLDAGAVIDPPTRATLWVAGYELAFRPASPAHAIVDAAVEAAKDHHRASGGFVNALLRRLATDLEKSPAPSLPEAFVAGAPRWLKRALDRAMGAGEAERYLAAGPWPPPLGLRVRRGTREAWLAQLRAGVPEATFEPSPVSEHAIRCGSGGGDPRAWP
ncbi:MAG: Sun protein, partial [Myxococcales bacterium]